MMRKVRAADFVLLDDPSYDGASLEVLLTLFHR